MIYNTQVIFANRETADKFDQIKQGRLSPDFLSAVIDFILSGDSRTLLKFSNYLHSSVKEMITESSTSEGASTNPQETLDTDAVMRICKDFVASALGAHDDRILSLESRVKLLSSVIEGMSGTVTKNVSVVTSPIEESQNSDSESQHADEAPNGVVNKVLDIGCEVVHTEPQDGRLEATGDESEQCGVSQEDSDEGKSQQEEESAESTELDDTQSSEHGEEEVTSINPLLASLPKKGDILGRLQSVASDDMAHADEYGEKPLIPINRRTLESLGESPDGSATDTSDDAPTEMSGTIIAFPGTQKKGNSQLDEVAQAISSYISESGLLVGGGIEPVRKLLTDTPSVKYDDILGKFGPAITGQIYSTAYYDAQLGAWYKQPEQEDSKEDRPLMQEPDHRAKIGVDLFKDILIAAETNKNYAMIKRIMISGGYTAEDVSGIISKESLEIALR